MRIPSPAQAGIGAAIAAELAQDATVLMLVARSPIYSAR